MKKKREKNISILSHLKPREKKKKEKKKKKIGKKWFIHILISHQFIKQKKNL
jgi:hypothetical protein